MYEPLFSRLSSQFHLIAPDYPGFGHSDAPTTSQFAYTYCINRISSNVARARFRISEVVALTLAFYKRNYIEGLFLSSGIIRSPDYTMEQLVRVARSLRSDHLFAGYIHLKTIPEASPELIAEAGRMGRSPLDQY